MGCKKKQESIFEKFRKKSKSNKKNEEELNDHDWQGPPLGTNILMFSPEIKKVKHLAIGEGHMIALVENQLK